MAFPDFKPAQPLALRNLNRKYAEWDHRRNKRRTHIKFSQQFKAAAYELAIRFGRKSTIHGMNRLFQENSNKYERLFWLLAVVLALLGSVYVCLIISRRFNAGSLQTIVDSTAMPVFEIAFPVITICNANRLNWQRLDEAKERFLPHENNTEILRMFELVISLYDNIKFADFEVFKVLENQPVELVNHVNFSLVFDFMTWRCEEILTDCVWRHYGMNCCDIFSKGKTKNGLCWMFNTLATEEGKRMAEVDSKYPWRTGSAGPTSALTLRVMLNPEKHFRNTNEKGITVMISEAHVWHRDPFFIPANTETMIDVEPIIYFYDNDTRSLSSAQRKCVFKDEHNSHDFKSLYGFIYMIENCQSECHQEYLNRYCGCTMDLLFPPGNCLILIIITNCQIYETNYSKGQYSSCKVKDLLCLARNNDYFRYSHQPDEEEYVRNNYEGMSCKCFRNCYSLNFVSDVRPSFLPTDVRGNKSYIDLDVHFRFETMMVYRTSLVFGWIDLMVAFGGIAGLFLGCSLISAMELLYFAFVEVPTFVFNELKTKEHSKNNQLQQHTKQQLQNQHRNNFLPKKRNWGLNNRIMAVQNLKNNETLIDGKNFNKTNSLQRWTHQYYLTNKHNY